MRPAAGPDSHQHVIEDFLAGGNNCPQHRCAKDLQPCPETDPSSCPALALTLPVLQVFTTFTPAINSYTSRRPSVASLGKKE